MKLQQQIELVQQKIITFYQRFTRQQRILIGIGLAAILIMIVVVLTTVIKNPSINEPNKSQSTPTQTDTESSILNEDVSLTFAPPAVVVNAVNNTSFGKADIVIYTAKERYFNELTFVLKYDPTYLEKVVVTKSTDQYSPVKDFKTVTNKVNTADGTVELTLTSLGSVMARGKIAQLSFEPSGPFSNLRTVVTITDKSYAVLPNGERYPLTANDLQVIFPNTAPLK